MKTNLVQHSGQIADIEKILARGEDISNSQADIIGYYCKGLVEVVDNGLSSLAKWLWVVREYRLWEQMELESDGEKVCFETQEQFISYLQKNPSVINQRAIRRTTFFDLPKAYEKLVVEHNVSETDFGILGHRAIEIVRVVEHQEREGKTPDVKKWVEIAINKMEAHFESEIAKAKGQDELKQTICTFPVQILIDFLEKTKIDEIKKANKVAIFRNMDVGEKGYPGMELR